MNEVKVWNGSADEAFTFYMDDRELHEFCSFMNPQEVTDVFEHRENDLTYYIMKGYVSMINFRKVFA